MNKSTPTYILFLALVLCIASCSNPPKNAFAGRYAGMMKGQQVRLALEPAGKSAYTGGLRDVNYLYLVKAADLDGRLTGTALDSVHGITFEFDGELISDSLVMHIRLTRPAQSKPLRLAFIRVDEAGEQHTASTPEDTGSSSIAQTAYGRSFDKSVIGRWYKQPGANVSEDTAHKVLPDDATMSFNANGTLSTGRSKDSTGILSDALIPGVTWFTQNNHIFITIFRNGQSTLVDLGSYRLAGDTLHMSGSKEQTMVLVRVKNR